MRFGWPPALVDSLDPDYLDELAARITAGHELDQDRAREARRRQEQAGRRGRHQGVPGRFVTQTVAIE